MRPNVFALLVAAALAAPGLATAAPTLTPAQAHAVVAETVRLVKADYVFPEKRDAIAAAIEAADKAGRYNVANPGDLSDRLTSDLYAASHDRHLWLKYDPDQSTSLGAHDVGPDREGGEYFQRQAIRRHHGLESLSILDGNIRYLKITNFIWLDDQTPQVIDDAARFLADGDAVIIDLRGNGGGSAAAVERVIGYFMKSEGQPMMNFHNGLSGEGRTTYVPNDLPGSRMVGKPLYVLTDGGTGSAAEEFAYHIQQFKLGVLIGQTTAGAANNDALFPAGDGFVVSISVGRPTHPVSGTNWEGVGVAPDVAVDPAAALDQAEVMALKGLLDKTQGDRRAEIEWAMVPVQARLKPLVLSPAELKAYAGVYGIRTIRLEGDHLTYQRESRPPIRLAPLAPDLFAFGNTDQLRVRFRRAGGKIVGFDQITADGQVIPSDRTG